MAQARELMDRLTDAILVNRDLKAGAELFAADAVIVTPDRGTLTGREHMMEYARQFIDAFPDIRVENHRKYSDGNAAIDESIYVGTNTGPLIGPDGESIPATGRPIRLRSCEVATEENGEIRRYEFYYDQMELLGQLGLLEPPVTG